MTGLCSDAWNIRITSLGHIDNDWRGGKMKYKLVIKSSCILALLFSTAACTKIDAQHLNSTQSSNIVNGQNATTQDVQTSSFANPVVAIFALLNEATGEGALCTGTLIAPTIVLTAGHCVIDATVNTKITVSFQVLDLFADQNSSNTILAKSFVIHPNYVSAHTNKTINQVDDLALILLSAPAPASVQPAKLAPSQMDLAGLTTLTDVGFGQADDKKNTQNDGAGVMRYLEFSADQVMVYSGAGPLNGMIIADGQSKSVCHGDSGGPLFAGSTSNSQRVIVGVNDLVLPVYSGQEQVDYQAAQQAGDLAPFYQKYPDAHICLGYNAFVDVSTHLDWINSTSASLVAGK